VFSKISRYRAEPDVASVDAAGRTLLSKRLRIVPVVTGQFRHLVTDHERVDQLAYKYYKQPRKWWRICDANPEFMSPQALLGKGTTAVARFPVTFVGTPPWSAVHSALSAEVGIEDVAVVEEVELLPEEQIVGAEIVLVLVERVLRSLRVTFNRKNLDLTRIAELIEAQGFGVGEPQMIGRTGKPIVIPPDPAGARR
jgi:hypothetical protein